MRRILLLIAGAVMALSLSSASAGSACVSAYAEANGQVLANENHCVDLP